MSDNTDYKRDEAMAVPIEDKYLTTRGVEKDYPRLEFSCELEGRDRVQYWTSNIILELDHQPRTVIMGDRENDSVDGNTLNRRSAIISAVKARVRKKTHKFRIVVPT
jgi:hypothetical protein